MVELYQCFLDGLESSHIDYTAPRCDGAIECSRDAASTAIRRTIVSLQTHSELQGERIVWVRMEDSESGLRCFVDSSVSRELQVLSSDTVHHSALIGMILRMQGFEMDPDSGMAPSTLRACHRRLWRQHNVHCQLGPPARRIPPFLQLW